MSMTGRRLPDGVDLFAAGDYGRLEEGAEQKRWVWYARPPKGHLGSLRNHHVTEHPDGTITVSPSILVKTTADDGSPEEWHGFLEAGIWREC
jgi:hypothetical protein